jgi:hypothetical protein
MKVVSFLWPHLWRLVASLLFLAGIFWFLLPPAAFVLAPLMILFGAGPVNFVWFAVIALLVYYGVTRTQPAYALAPVVLYIGWCAASVDMRRDVERIERAGNYAPAVPPGTASYRTLIIDDFNGSGINPNVLANGLIDRLIKVTRGYDQKEIKSITERLLVREGCTTQERIYSSDLSKAGRVDECYRERKLDAVPDGLVIAYRYKTDIVHGAIGCCNELQVNRREQDNEEPLFVWRQGYARVLAYTPFYGGPGAFMGTVQPGIWESSGGPWQTVRYGAPDIERYTAVKAIYGIGPNDPPIPAAPISTDDLLARAQALSQGDPVQKNAVASLLNKVKARGPVDDRWLRIAATLIGGDSFLTRAQEVNELLRNLPQEQRVTLAGYVMERIATSGICSDCPGSESRWFSWMSNAPELKRYTDRAEEIFERTDLQLWQYEAALRLININGALAKDANKSLRRQLFASIVSDTSAAFSDRAVAFRRVVHPADETEREAQRDAVAAKIDLTTDAMLDQFISAYWSFKDAQGASPETARQIADLCARIARIADPAILATIRTHSRVQCRKQG